MLRVERKVNEEKLSPVSSSSDTSIDTSKVRVEDLGSEDHLDRRQINSSSISEPSSSKITSSSTTTTTLDSPSSSSTFIANETLNDGDSNETNEVRKRRLQKFLQSN